MTQKHVKSESFCICRDSLGHLTKELINFPQNSALSMLLSILLYGCEIWTIRKNDLKKLVAFEMCCYMTILYISLKDKIRNEEVLRRISSCRTSPKRILNSITKSQLTWFGHICRVDNTRLSNVYSWNWSLAPTDKGDQEKVGKMTLLLVVPFMRHMQECRRQEQMGWICL